MMFDWTHVVLSAPKKTPVFFLHRLILLDLRTNRMQKIKNIYEDQADYSYRSVKM